MPTQTFNASGQESVAAQWYSGATPSSIAWAALNDSSFSHCAPGAKKTGYSGTLKNYSITSTIPAGATITQVRLNAKYYVSTKSSIIEFHTAAIVSESELTEHVDTSEPLTESDTWIDITSDRSWVRDDFTDAAFKVRIEAYQGNSSTAVTLYINCLLVEITWLESVSNRIISKYNVRGWISTAKKSIYNIRKYVVDNEYNYRTKIPITGVSSEQTNYQMKLRIYKTTGNNIPGTIYLNNHALNWPYDIKFTDASGNNLDYWRESGDSSAMTVWVECGTIPATVTTDFYLYYGKSGASDDSNGANTFPFFDHFPGASIDTGKWGGDTSNTYVTDSILTVYGATAWKKVYGLTTFSPPYALRLYGQFDNYTTGYGEVAWEDPVTTDMASIYTGVTPKVRCYKDGTGTSQNSSLDSNLHIYEIEWDTSSTKFLKDEIEMTGSPVNTNIPTKALPVFFNAYGASGNSDVHCDWIFVRNYATTEPSWTTPDSESSALTDYPARGFLYNLGTGIIIKKAVILMYNVHGLIEKVTKFIYNLSSSQFVTKVVGLLYTIHIFVSGHNTLGSLAFKKDITNPMLSPNGGWEGTENIADQIIMEESDHFRMYYGGDLNGDQTGGVGLATTSKGYPKPSGSWVRYSGNPIYQDGSDYVRIGSVFKTDFDSKYYLYYQRGITGQHIALASSSDGISWSKYGDVLAPSGDETVVEDAAVVAPDSTHWYMYYSYRTAGKTLPGIRVATSSNGLSWSKITGDVLTTGSAGSWDDYYIEHHQALYTSSKYFLVYEAYDGSNWGGGLAESSDPTASFTKSAFNPIISRSGKSGAFDEYHVATPSLFKYGGKWFLSFTGGNAISYPSSTWKIALAYNTGLEREFSYHIWNRIYSVRIHLYNIRSFISGLNHQLYTIRGFVSRVNKQLYHIWNKITKTNLQLYNLKNFASRTNRQLYHIWNRISRTSGYLYNLRNFISKINLQSYHIRNFVSRVNRQLYNLSGILVRIWVAAYNIRKTISRGNIQLYNIRVAVSRLNGQLYNLKNFVSRKLPGLYNIRNFVSKTNRQLYHIWNTIVRKITHIYNLKNFVSKRFGGLYNLKNFVSRISEQLYNIRNYISRTGSSLYNIRNYALRINWQLYHIRNFISKLNKQSYNIRNFVTLARGFIYNLSGKLVRVFAAIYNIRYVLTTKREFLYNIRTSIARTNASLYNIRKSITKGIWDIYNILGSITKKITVLYNIRGFVVQSRIFVYSLGGVIVRVLNACYAIGNAIQKVLSTGYNMRNFTTRVHSFVYNIRTSLSKKEGFVYNIRTGILTARGFIYNIRNGIIQSLNSIYNLRNLVASTGRFLYNIRLSIDKKLASFYTIRNFASRTFNTIYNMSGILVRVSKYIYNIRTSISESRAFSYNIRSAVSRARTTIYRIFNFVSATRSSRYNIRGFVSSIRTTVYNIHKTIDGMIHGLYNIRGLVESTKTFVYQIRSGVSVGFHSLYNILETAYSTRSFTYNISPTIIINRVLRAVYVLFGIEGALSDPYNRLMNELYDYLLSLTVPGGEFDGFIIYKRKPKNKPLFFPCIIIDMDRGDSRAMFGNDYDEMGVVTIEIMFKKDYSVTLRW